MYRKRRESSEKQSKGKADLSQFGIFGIPNVNDMEDGEDDDPELEAELMTILSSGPNKSREQLKSSPKKAKGLPGSNLDQMIAESLRDVPSDESSGDEDDPSLLAELQAFTGEEVTSEANAGSVQETPSSLVGVLKERISMYSSAEANAKSAGDTAKARRLGRGLKTLDELLRKAERGVAINEQDIPLPVAVSSPTHPPSKPDGVLENEVDPSPPPVPPRRSVSERKPPEDSNEKTLEMLRQRRDEYKKAAVVAKRAGDLETAKAHVRVIKQFENVISGVERGESVDLSSMPAPPMAPETQREEAGVQPSRPAPLPPQPVPSVSPSQPLPSVSPSQPLPSVSPSQPGPSSSQPQPQQDTEVVMPASMLEALEQRLAVFKKQEETAKSEGNSSKARRMGRISKQYEDAIRLHKAGKDIPVDELPTPPGFPPIPVDKPAAKPEEGSGKQAVQPPPVSPRQGSQLTPTPVSPQQPPPSPTVTPPKPSGRTSRQEKQLEVLLKRQKEWKEAAIASKKAGDIAKAKDCLRQAKGFDALIEASRSGLPVDLTTIPVPPKDKIDADFEIVNATDCLPLPTGTNSDIYKQLKSDLDSQFKMCLETRAYYKGLGDVANANKFENLAVQTKRDLDRVTVLHEKDDPVPRFHYEHRMFSIVRAHSDLNDNDLELNIIQGINYNVPNPKEIDTYVRYEFPFPAEDPKKDKTSTVYNTNNPEYKTTVIIPIVRNSRACQRVFKRHSLKLEVWSKGGFLRSDTLIGTVNVKLQRLETKCVIHDSFDLMDGRKTVGGKLEVKIRVRHPIQQNEIEDVKERWLIID